MKPLRTRDDFLDLAARCAPTRACERVIRERGATVAGGFTFPGGHRGWVVTARSDTKVWLIAIICDEVRRKYSIQYLDALPERTKMPLPPRRLKLNAVPKYLKENFGLEVTRQTVYNWSKLGVKDETLQTTTIKSDPSLVHSSMVRVTTAEWLHDFFRRTGIVLANAGHTQDRHGQSEAGGLSSD